MKKLEIVYKNIDELLPYINNARTHDEMQINQIASSIKEFGFNSPIAIDNDNMILCGHGRLLGAKKLGLKEVPTVCLSHLTPQEKKAYILADNKIALNSGWDFDLLKLEFEELKSVNFDLSLTGFSDNEINDLFNDIDQKEVKDDDFDVDSQISDVNIKSALGDIWICGNHRVMCGDSTSENDVKALMQDEKADLVFTDPPYGMKKEAEGVLNDNLNYDDLLEFNKRWISLSFKFLKDNGSWYCWGIDEPLMDIYSNILKPMIKAQKLTFRNLITWDKGNGQGQNAKDFRCYAPADEKCLFVMCGVQGFNNNADNYFEKWEPIRLYLKEQRDLMGWSNADMKVMLGHSPKSGCHWFDKSQWSFPTKEEYQTWQKQAEEKAFKREYDDLKREYDDLKREYYKTRAYFDNVHDNMNSVWHFERTSVEERKDTGNHATPKPLALCARAIKTSSRDNEKVLDLFGGSGSTLIACEQLGRKARLMELDPKYVDVIVKRWQKLTGLEVYRLSDNVKFNDL